jgi:hypothetical protein
MMDQEIRILPGDYAMYIARALATEGGHLAIGLGGFLRRWFERFRIRQRLLLSILP